MQNKGKNSKNTCLSAIYERWKMEKLEKIEKKIREKKFARMDIRMEYKRIMSRGKKYAQYFCS